MIEDARPPDNNPEVHCANLVQLLKQLPPNEIVDYERIFCSLVDDAYRADLWDVAYYINGGCSDDGFVYFRWWLAAQGEDVFNLALADPESLAEISGASEDLVWETYGYVALKAYCEVTGEEDIPYHFHSERGGPGSRPPLQGDPAGDDLDFARKFPMVWRLLDAPPKIDPAWLKWNDGAIMHMAQSIHGNKRWSELPILADALEEAGCADQFLLDHLRAGRRHARGCWVTYFLLHC